LRQNQPRWQQLLSLSSYCLYMPYMSLSGFLKAQTLYRAARRRAAESEGCLFYDATPEIPADGKHFADSSHFRDAGSRKMAKLLSEKLVKNDHFKAIVHN